jgi:hypothetical protein
MTKKEMAFNLAKRIAYDEKTVQRLKNECPDNKEQIEYVNNLICGIKMAAQTLKIDVERNIIPHVRYMLKLTEKEISELTLNDMEDYNRFLV